MKRMLMVGVAAMAVWAVAAPGEGQPSVGRREGFLLSQAMAEMQRVSGQVDVVQANCDALERRVANIESGKGDIGAVKSDIESLRRDIDSVRREMASMREEITRDLTRKITVLLKSAAPAPEPRPPARPPQPPANCRSYTVQAGDTLSLIAQAFKTTVTQIKEINHLRSDNLRIGQELLVPAPGKR